MTPFPYTIAKQYRLNRFGAEPVIVCEHFGCSYPDGVSELDALREANSMNVWAMRTHILCHYFAVPIPLYIEAAP